MDWKVYGRPTGGGEPRPLHGQPDEGFEGPGKALLWFTEAGGDVNRLGVDRYVMRSDGARPCGADTRRREDEDVAA